MTVGLGILIAVLLFRWVIPTFWDWITNFRPELADHSKRGRVLGHRGPGPRSFKGRAGRREWWLTMLGNTVAGAIVGLVPVIGTLLSLPWIICTLAVNARRLHDMSLSGWLQLAPMVFGFAFAFGYMYLGGPDNPPAWTFEWTTPAGMLTAFGLLTTFVYLAFYAWVGFFPGKDGPNTFGEADLKAEQAAA